MPKTRTGYRTRIAWYTTQAGAVAAAISAAITSAHHHMPILLTAALSASLMAVLSEIAATLIYRKRSIACPAGCGFTITAPRETADPYQYVLDEHYRTVHTTTGDRAPAHERTTR